MAQTMSKPRLLIVDDDPAICDFLRTVAAELDMEVLDATMASKALAIVDSFKPNIIILDLRMPDMDGVEVIAKLAEKHCDASIVLASGMDQRTLSSVQALGREHNLDMLATLTKPMTIEALEGVLKPVIEKLTTLGVEDEASGQISVAQVGGFGLIVDYEPEMESLHSPNHSRTCLRALPSIRLDSGRMLSEKQSFAHTKASELGEGFFKSVLSEISADLGRWARNGFCPKIIIGVPAFLIENNHLPKVMERIIESQGMKNGSVVLELFESDTSRLNALSQEVLSRMRLKGFKTRAVVTDGGESALSGIDSLPIDQFIVDLGDCADSKTELSDIETEFLYSSLNSVANRKGIEVCAINVNTVRVYQLALQCRFNLIRGSEVHVALSAPEVLSAHLSGHFDSHKLDLIGPV
jgi:CheY-like chemotaxis protein